MYVPVFYTLRVRCPSIFSSIAIEINVPLTFVTLRHDFKKAGSVLFDICGHSIFAYLGGVTVVYYLYYRRKSTCLLQVLSLILPFINLRRGKS